MKLFKNNIKIVIETDFFTSFTSSVVGAATLTPKHRLRIAGMTLLVELQHKISLHVAVYFSIVRRKEC